MDTSLSPKELDVQRMLACEVHIGTRNVDFQMERYVWRRRADGVFPRELAPLAPCAPRAAADRPARPLPQASTSSTWARPWTSSSSPPA